MAIETNKKGTLSLNFQHEFITLRTPNGNFTTSYGGSKTSGRMANVPGLLKQLDTFVQTFQGTKGDAMRALMDEQKLASFWPDWNKKYEIKFGVGDTVSVDGMPQYQNGKIQKMNKKTASVLFGNTKVSVPFEMLK
jgi:hypothetical protein